MNIPKPLLAEVFKHAESEYPRECCGVILGRRGDVEALTRVIPCENIQEISADKDAAKPSFSARHAYRIDPSQLLTIQKENRKTDERIAVFYHSHPDSPPVLSRRDMEMACPVGRPLYPDVWYLVVSVQNAAVISWRVFRWDPVTKTYDAQGQTDC